VQPLFNYPDLFLTAIQKSEETKPKWFMVDVQFISRAGHFVPYRLLREIAAGSAKPSTNIEYIGEEGVRAIKGSLKRPDRLELKPIAFCHTDMVLVHRGRLSVQRVEAEAWDVIEQMAEKGGWSEEEVAKGKGGTKGAGEKRKRKRGAVEEVTVKTKRRS
jgi:EVE domain